jgi:hypothetical protein
MTQVAAASASPAGPSMGLAARVLNVFLSPRDAYAAVAARPRAFGVMVVVLVVMIAAQATFLSSDVGRNAALDQQVSTMRSFGMNVTDQMVQQMETRMAYAPYTTAVSLIIFVPLLAAAVAGILLAIFTVVTGGGATFKEVFAVVAHSQLIGALQQVFSLPIMYARGEMTSPTKLAVFLPMLDDNGFAYYLLSAIDLFYLWSCINVAIGIAVLYKRRTGPIAAVLLGIYAVIAVIIAVVRSL